MVGWFWDRLWGGSWQLVGLLAAALFFCEVGMAVVYTTAALCKKRVENYDVGLADADIEEFINEAEGILNGVMGLDLTSSFSAVKLGHRVLREGATLYAAIQMILFNPVGFSSTREAFAIADAMWEEFHFILGLLRDKGVVQYIEGL